MLLIFSLLPARAAEPAAEPVDVVEASVATFSAWTDGDLLGPAHPYCQLTDSGYVGTWTEQRTIYTCVYTDEGDILQFMVTQIVAVTEWCSDDGQLQRKETIEEFRVHPSAPEGAPPICDPGIQVMHSEVIDGGRFLQVEKVSNPYDIYKLAAP